MTENEDREINRCSNVIAASTVPGVDARVSAHLSVLSCDVSSGVGHILREKRSLRCVYRANGSSRGDIYKARCRNGGSDWAPQRLDSLSGA